MLLPVQDVVCWRVLCCNDGFASGSSGDASDVFEFVPRRRSLGSLSCCADTKERQVTTKAAVSRCVRFMMIRCSSRFASFNE